MAIKKTGWARHLGLRRNGLSDYELQREIGRGGMSVVYRARRKADDLSVAIKIIKPEKIEVTEVLDKMFPRGPEGEVGASLHHPNIVKTFDHGRTGHQYFIVMEFVDGPNLKELIDSGDPRWRDHTFEILLGFGRGVQHLHHCHLIHRDICPKNVLLADGVTPKLIDFGLAIPANFTGPWLWQRTGTPAYMAPEAVRGQAVDVRADIYSFGVSAFEVLTGDRPFREARGAAIDMHAAKMVGHLNVEPRALRAIASCLPLPLERVISKTMAKLPADRYSTMDDLMRDLQVIDQAFFAGPPTTTGTGTAGG